MVPEKTAIQYTDERALHFAKKAAHNKVESLSCYTLAIPADLGVSASLALGHSDLWSRTCPFCLSLLITRLTNWLQFRKPHQLWGIYRAAQRLIENHRFQYDYRIGEYGSPLTAKISSLEMWHASIYRRTSSGCR